MNNKIFQEVNVSKNHFYFINLYDKYNTGVKLQNLIVTNEYSEYSRVYKILGDIVFKQGIENIFGSTDKNLYMLIPKITILKIISEQKFLSFYIEPKFNGHSSNTEYYLAGILSYNKDKYHFGGLSIEDILEDANKYHQFINPVSVENYIKNLCIELGYD